MMSMGEDAAISHISNSIFYISIGTNDYIHYYLRNVSGVQSLFPPSSFNHFLVITVKQGIKVSSFYPLASYYLILHIYHSVFGYVTMGGGVQSS